MQVTCSTNPCEIVLQVELLPFAMDLAAAGEIAVAVMGIWAVGWAFRELIRMVRDSDSGIEDRESDEGRGG